MASESEEGGEEYLGSDLDEEAFLAAAYGTDEEGYLQGATTGARACCVVILLLLLPPLAGWQREWRCSGTHGGVRPQKRRRWPSLPAAHSAAPRPLLPTHPLRQPRRTTTRRLPTFLGPMATR